MKRNDRAFVMSFSDEADIRQDLTDDIGTLHSSIDALNPKGATALYNAVYQSIEKLKNEQGRKVIVLLSDGYNTVWGIDKEEVLEAAKKADVKIYSIGIYLLRFMPLDNSPPIAALMQRAERGESVLERLSYWTGGEAYFPYRLSELDEVYMRIAQELRLQYSMGYTSSNRKRDGKWREIEVKINKNNLTARTKKGYYAPQSE